MTELDLESLVANYQYGYLSTFIEDNGLQVLPELFATLSPGFSFTSFMKKVPKRYQKRFLTRLLFSIYSLDFKLSHFSDIEAYLFQLLAAIMPFGPIWKKMTEDEKAQVFAFSQKHFDEGGFVIAQLVKKEPPKEVDRICELLKPYHVSKKGVKAFLRIFGEYDHQVPPDLRHLEKMSLADKLEVMDKEIVVKHIQALTTNPEWYQEGINCLVHALPTCNKDLSKLYWLESTAKGLKKLSKYVRLRHPIYVLDQSDQMIFDNNAAYIEKVKKRYKVDIVHMDTKSCIELATKLRLEKLLGENVPFGYAAARNAIFLLVPHLCKNSDIFIHMGDDDVYMDESAPFSDALWAYFHKDSYTSRMGYVRGRYARDSSFTKESVLYDTSRILSQCPWIDDPYPHGMSGLLTKPKLCLNLPFGQEEEHMLAVERILYDFRKPAIHLAGPRYPEVDELPTSRFSGLATFLRRRHVDIFQRLLVTELLDPQNRYGMCALVWQKEHFTSFHEMIEFLKRDTTKKAVERIFWDNFSRLIKAFSEKPEGSYLHSSQALQEIIDTNWDLEFLDHKDLQAFYKTFKEEAIRYKEFAFSVYKNPHVIKKPDTPLAYSLYLICKEIGKGGFLDAVKGRCCINHHRVTEITEMI